MKASARVGRGCGKRIRLLTNEYSTPTSLMSHCTSTSKVGCLRYPLVDQYSTEVAVRKQGNDDG